MVHLPSLPKNETLLDVFKTFPETNRPLFHEALLRGTSPFTEAERELIAACVSGLNGCRYCHGVHTATAERLGVKEGAVAALLAGDAKADIPAKMRPVLAVATKLTEARRRRRQVRRRGRLRHGMGWAGLRGRRRAAPCRPRLSAH
jgi:AhpD family alkylhydroperoxidase